MATQRDHSWRFFRAGGVDQVRLGTGQDLLALGQLDQKLWMALSCPTTGLALDARTLELMDRDRDGRLRAPDVVHAAEWLGAMLEDAEGLVAGSALLPVAQISERTEEGARLRRAARWLLDRLEKPEATELSTEDVLSAVTGFAASRFNGDGILPVASAGTPELERAVQALLDTVGSEPDRSGEPGISLALLERFFTEAEAHLTWQARGTADPTELLPLGADTEAGAALLASLREKIDDYFMRCRLAAFDPRATAALNRDEAEYGALASQLLSPSGQEVRAFPLARIEAGRPLPLVQGVNPAWAQPLAELTAKVVTPLLGARSTLPEADWLTLCRRFDAHAAWQAERPESKVSTLGLDRLRELTTGDTRAALQALIEQDAAQAEEAALLESLERLVRFRRDLFKLTRNFVNFEDFYSMGSGAVFLAGVLYLDARAFSLCVRVNSADGHATLATLSRTYLAYCECTRKDTHEKMLIACAVTAGDADSLMVGRNGIFYDRDGVDWSAQVVKLLDHPISISQAFFLPYKTVAKLIGEQVEKFASAREKQVQSQAAANISDVGAKADAAPALPAEAPAAKPPAATPAAPPFDIAKFAGIFAAIGLALAAVGSAVTALITGFIGLRWWQMPLALLGLMLLISGPSMLLAWLKLRQRSLGPILDANGWAVNARAKINLPFGAALTAQAKLPPNAERSLTDPFAPQRGPWRWLLVLLLLAGLVALGVYLGVPQRWLAGAAP